MMRLFVNLSFKNELSKNPELEVFKTVINKLNEQAQSSLSLSQILSGSGYHPNYINTLLNKHCKMTPMEY